jgi:hypothetical protein
LGREVIEEGEGVAYGSAGRAWAVLTLFAVSVLLLSLPALLAVGVAPSGGAVLAWLAASLAVVSGGGRLAAAIWGLASRFVGSPGLGAVAASTK